MRSLLREEHCRDRWYPTPVEKFRTYLKLDCNIDGADQLKSNIAYNLQYLQFLQKELDELNLSSVMYCMLYKTYIITGMGIVEGLFSNLLKSNHKWNTNVWKSKLKFISNEQKLDGVALRTESEIFEKVEPYNMRMDLDSMLKKIESKKLLKLDHVMYPVIKRLRRLRNRIHLQEAAHQFDTDYFNFDKDVKDEMGMILNELLSSEEFCSIPAQAEIYDYLKPVE